MVGVGVLAAVAAAYTYTYVAESAGEWCGYEHWTRTGCTEGCEECPDDTGDDAIFETNATVEESDVEADDVTIIDADVRFGKYSTGYCQEVFHLYFDSITIFATNGNTAQLRGGACTTTLTQ